MSTAILRSDSGSGSVLGSGQQQCLTIGSGYGWFRLRLCLPLVQDQGASTVGSDSCVTVGSDSYGTIGSS